MNSIAQEARFRQRVVKYFYKHGATEVSIRFKVCRQSVYNWAKRYDGTWKSLVELSHRPHHHPKEHTQAEKEMILRRYPYYKNDMIALWDSLRKSDYARSYGSMLRVIKKWVNPELKKRTARKPKPYARAWYPGQKVQVDVKYVPSEYGVEPEEIRNAAISAYAKSRGLVSKLNNLKTEIEDQEVKLKVLKKYREVKHYGEELKALSGRAEKKYRKEYSVELAEYGLELSRNVQSENTQNLG